MSFALGPVQEMNPTILEKPTAPRMEKTAKILAITQIALLALAIAGAVAFVIATAVTFNAYLLIGVGICTAIALAVLGRNLCCRSMLKREETVFVPTHDSLYNKQDFEQGFQKKSTLAKKSIPWPEVENNTKLAGGRVIPSQRDLKV